MASFDYITNPEFRRSLEADYAELRRCADVNAAKAVHVLAGSIIEALLADLLVSLEIENEADVYRLSFAELVDRSRQEKLISQKVADLSSAIRGYRNLIHPGRSLRTAETVDEHSSPIALSLVELIAKDVAAERQRVYGLTAEQIIGKLEKDTSAVAIAEHLLADIRAQELERLLLRVIPERHARIDNPFDDLDEALQRTFEIAYEKAEVELRRRVAHEYTRRVREDSKAVIEHFDENFFQIDFLNHVTAEDGRMVRQHLIAALPSMSSYYRARGLSGVLDVTEVSGFVDALVRRATFPREDWKRAPAEKYLSSELGGMSDDSLAAAIDRLKDWQRTFGDKGQPAYETAVRRILGEEEVFDPDAVPDDLPF